MALTNKALISPKPIVTDVKKLSYDELDNFAQSVRRNRPYQALFYLINVFWRVENDGVLIDKKKDYIEDAIHDLGSAAELELQHIAPDKINQADFSFMDGVDYGKLLSEFTEITEMINLFNNNSSSSVFKNIVEMSRQLRPYQVELSTVAEAIQQLSSAVKEFSVEISQIADDLMYHEVDAIYESNIETFEDLIVYFNMLDTISLCLNEIHLSLLSISVDDEESEDNIQYNLEGLLAYRLEDLFKRTVDLDEF